MKLLTILVILPSLAYAGIGFGNMRVGDIDQLQKLERIQNSVFIKDLNLIKLNPNTKIVIAKPSENGVTEFATGTVVNKQWQINRYAAPTEIIERSDSDMAEQMKKSLEKKDWIEIQ